jgi:two-component system nitrate/nitrite response regulator NarL
MAGIIVVGPRSLLRVGLVSLLGTIGFELIEEADDIAHLAGHLGARPSPDVLIVCLLRAFENTVSTVGEMKAWRPMARIVFIVPKLDIEAMSTCFAAGACGYFLETISRDALRESLKLVNAGGKVFPSELASLFPMFTSKFDNPPPGNLAPPVSDLSRRELEILRCLTDGQSNKVIARNLAIAEATVKVHIKRILRKARVINRTQAALWAISTGIIGASVIHNSEAGSAFNRNQIPLRAVEYHD